MLEIAESSGAIQKEFLDFIDTPEAKQRLIQNTQELMDRGGFGSPTFFIDNTDMYFGNGAVLVKDGEIIAESYNQLIQLNDPTSHAEINVIRKASKILGNYRLNNTSLYVTLEPCH